jgi:hypothetical protein
MITQIVTVDDYIAGHRLHHVKRHKIIVALAVVALAVGGAISFASKGSMGWAMSGGAIGLLLVEWWQAQIGIPGNARKFYAQYKRINEPVELSWDAEFLVGQREDGQGKRKWSDYVKFLENDEVMLLYITDALWEVFPKHCFGDAALLEEFRQHAKVAGTS